MKKLLSLLILLFLLISCGGSKKAKLVENQKIPDKELFHTGMEFFNKGEYEKARLTFQTLINTYDDSPYLENAKFYIPLSYYKQGGIDNLLLAENGFRDFKIFFPTSQYTDDAQAYIVDINMKLMRGPTRDLTYTKKAKKALDDFFKEFPDSPLRKDMERRLMYVDNILAKSDFEKGKFYYKRKKYKAAANRFMECVKNYRTFFYRDEALFYLARSLEKIRRFNDSAIYYAEIVRGYPFSPYFKEAKDSLNKLEKPIPPVDEKLAKENLKYFKMKEKEPNFLVRPFKSFFGIFHHKPKPWEINSNGVNK